jgi:hypothetical protein
MTSTYHLAVATVKQIERRPLARLIEQSPPLYKGAAKGKT